MAPPEKKAFQTMSIPNAGLPPEGLNELNLFNYDDSKAGHHNLLTELTPAHAEFTKDTDILGMDCAVIEVAPKRGNYRGEAVGRVSVVNKYGYCLYDKLVVPNRAVVMNDKTKSTGIRQEDFLESATPRNVVINDVRKLLNGHILVGLGLVEKLQMLNIIHPKEMRRDIDEYILNKLGRPTMSYPRKMREFVNTVFEVDLQGEISSIKSAQAAVTLYKVFQGEWEQSISDRKFRNTSKAFRLPVEVPGAHLIKSSSFSASPSTTTISAVPQTQEFVKFEYDPTGQLVTCPIHATPERTNDSGIVAFACQLIGGNKDTNSFVARVSIVNEHGFCFFDKFVLHKAVVLQDETVLGIPKGDFLKIAQPLASVKDKLSDLLRNHVVVGHGVKASLASLGIDHPEEGIRDTDTYIRHNVLGINRSSAPLEVVVKEGLSTVRLGSNYTSIQAAQASMTLYQKYRIEWEESLRKVHKGVNMLEKSLNEFNKSKKTAAQATNGDPPPQPVVHATPERVHQSFEQSANKSVTGSESDSNTVTPFKYDDKLMAQKKNASSPKQVHAKMSIPTVAGLPMIGLNELKLFHYDSKGHLLTELTRAHAKFTTRTGILGMDCAVIEVRSKSGETVGRVSVVNEYGYCLYDKLVLVRRPVLNYKTQLTGIRQEDMENATPRDVVINDLKKLLNGHILVGLGLGEKLQMLNVAHPKGMRREIEEYVLKKIGRPMSYPRKMSEFVKAVFEVDLQGQISSIKNAQAAVTLYRVFLEEWELSISVDSGRRNKGEQVFQNTLKVFRPPVEAPVAQVIENSSAPPSTTTPTISVMPPTPFVKFDYDATGQLVTSPIHAIPERTKDSGIVAFACQMIRGNKRAADFVARVSIVNEHRYCLFDKFVFQKAMTVLQGETVFGIPKNDFLRIAQPFASVKDELSDLIKNHVVVGHGVKKSLAPLGIDHPKKGIRDTDKYIRYNVLGLNRSGVPLEVVVKKGLSTLRLEKNYTSIQAAQASMALYQKYRVEWEESIQRAHDEGAWNLLQRSLSEFNKSKRTTTETDVQVANAHSPHPVVVPAISAAQTHLTLKQSVAFENNNNYNAPPQSSEDPPVVQFQYDDVGSLVTLLTPENHGLTGETEIVSLACTLISVGPTPKVGRVSVVNQYGYCLYDKLVKPPTTPKNETPAPINYHTATTGITAKNMEHQGIPRGTVREEIKILLDGRTLICHKWKRNLSEMLKYHHSPGFIRDTSEFVCQKLGLARKKTDVHTLMMNALDVDLTQGNKLQSPITDAQALMLVYRRYQQEWEETVAKSNAIVKSLENMIVAGVFGSSGSTTVSPKGNIVLEPLVPGPGSFRQKALDALTRFEYDLAGNLLHVEEPAMVQHGFWTEAVALDCEMVEVIQNGCRKDALGRISVVNEHGYCLYDSFVKPSLPVSDYRTRFSGIRKEDLINAPIQDNVVAKLKPLLEDSIVVGHAIFENDFKVLPIWHPELKVRDTSIYYQFDRKMRCQPALKKLVKKFFQMDIQNKRHNPIQDAQASMALYLLEKGKCDQLFEVLSSMYRDHFGSSSSEGIKMFLTALRKALVESRKTKNQQFKKA